jgi:peroxiredoxin
MAQLRQDYQQFVERGAEVVVVGPEYREAFAQYWRTEQLPFVGLADPEHIVANLYSQEVNPLKLGRMPALLIVDKQGQVRFQRYGNAMQDIVPNEEVLRLLDRLNREPSVAERGGP